MLPEWADPEKALRMLTKALSQRGLLATAQEVVSRGGRGSRSVSLPGFDVFSRGKQISPYQWCVPRPRSDYADVLNAYEEYVDRNLGGLRNPHVTAYQAVRKGWSRAYFGSGQRSPTRWRSPLVKLVAMAQHFSDAPITIGGSRVRVDLGDWRMDVSGRQAWSNLHGRYMTPRRPAVDVGFHEVLVLPLRTPHALADLLEGRVEDEVLWLLNTVIQGEREERIPPISFDIEYGHRTIDGRRPRGMPIEIKGAALAAREILALEPNPGLIAELFEATVPYLMTSSAFIQKIGNPHREHPRMPKPETWARWKDVIEKAIEGVECRPA